MPDAITLRLNTREFRRSVRDLTERQARRAIADGLNKTAFEILDAEKAETRRVFKFAGSSTEQFLAGRGAFRFDKATERSLEARIFPSPSRGKRRREQILAKQQKGGRFASQKDALRFGDFIAVPVAVQRGPRGRVPARLLPGRVVRRRARGGRGVKGFVAGRAILERTEGRVRVLYALVKSVDIAPRFDFYRTARDTAQRVIGAKMRRAFEKVRVR